MRLSNGYTNAYHPVFFVQRNTANRNHTRHFWHGHKGKQSRELCNVHVPELVGEVLTAFGCIVLEAAAERCSTTKPGGFQPSRGDG